jgi:transposase-like protein
MSQARQGTGAQYLAMRARIVLRCAEGGTNKQAAADLGVDESTVERWRARLIARRPRWTCMMSRGRDDRRRILLDRVEDVIVATLGPCRARTRAGRASMAARGGLSKSTIGRVWKKSGLKPHLQDSFKLSAELPGKPLIIFDTSRQRIPPLAAYS